jgi:hypothetical protein
MLMLGWAVAAPLVAVEPAGLQLAAERVPGEWSLVAWSDVRSGQPATLGGQQVTACTAVATTKDAALDDLKRAVLLADGVEAAVREAERAVCPTGTPEDLARIAFLTGVAAMEAGEEEAGAAQFVRARTFAPGLGWDEAFSDRYRPAFDAARPLEGTVRLEILPEGQVVFPTAELPSTRHLVRVGAKAYWTELAFDDVVVVPRAFDDAALGWIADDARRADLSRLLAVSLGEGVEAGVVHDGTVWTGRTGRSDWVAHRPVAVVPEVESPPETPPRRRRWAAPLIGAGAVLTAVGAGAAAEAYLTANTGTADDHLRRKARYRVGNAVWAGGSVVMAVGIVGGL